MRQSTHVALVITQGERVLSIVIPVEYLYGTVNETVFVTQFGLGWGITYAVGLCCIGCI
jgi:hypothetical protein